MTRYFSLFVIVMAGLFMAGCKQHKKVDEGFLREAAMDYSSSDSAEIKRLVDEYIGYLKQGDYERLADMLYLVQDNHAVPYSEGLRDSFITGLKTIPVVDATLNSILLRDNVNNEVGIAIKMIDDGDPNSKRGITHLYLNPVVFNGKWYLTLLDMNAEGYRKIYGE